MLVRILLAVIVVLSGAPALLADGSENGLKSGDFTRLENEQHGFSLEYPTALQRMDVADPRVAFAARTAGSGYPTINLIVEPGVGPKPRDFGAHSNRLLLEYRRAGLQDPRLVSHAERAIAGRPSLFAVIDYGSGGEAYRAFVALVPGTGRHFILTAVAPAAAPEAASEMMEEILGRFHTDEPTPEAMEVNRSRAFLSGAAATILVAAGFFLVVWSVQRRAPKAP